MKLITFAAEHGVVEAVEKLVDMYRSGHGVERDYLKAIEWQEKKIKLFEERYTADPTEDNQSNLFWVIIKCGDYYNELAKLIKAKEKYEQAIALFGTAELSTLSHNQRRNYSVSCNRIGNICKAEGDLSGAKVYYEKGLEISVALADKTGTAESYDDLALSYYKLAFLDATAKKEYLKKAVEIYEMLVRSCPNVARYRQNLDIIKRAYANA